MASPLHRAAKEGAVERTLSLLSTGVTDINQRGPRGSTPLMYAACYGHSRVVRALLNKGASVSAVSDDGVAALHFSAQEGHVDATKLLVKASSDLETACADGFTPLHMAAERGHSEVVRALIEAGANANSRGLDGATPLYMAARGGHVRAIKVLLRANADPLLAQSSSPGELVLPLDVAAGHGRLEAVRELIRELGIEGCGGASGGLDALMAAPFADDQSFEVISLLTAAGVVDDGRALQNAVAHGRESSVRFLLGQDEWKAVEGKGATYLHAALLSAVKYARISSPRNVRMLIDAGVDTAAVVRVNGIAGGRVIFSGTPLDLTNACLRIKKMDGKDFTEEQLRILEDIRRLMMRVEAIHAVSWLWAKSAPSSTHGAVGSTGHMTTTSNPLASILPILRRRAGRRRVILASLLRTAQKP